MEDKVRKSGTKSREVKVVLVSVIGRAIVTARG
jgi:hypothetical protein